MNKFLYILSLCLSVSHAHELNTHKVIPLTIAQEGFTRITVEGETIQHVFCHPADVEEYVKLHKGGHVFVVGEGLKKPLHLSLVTDKGQTQDLKLTAARKAVEPIILKAPPKKEEPKETISDILSNFAQGNQPPDFKGIGLDVLPREQGPLKYYPLTAWIKNNHKIIKWEVKNIGDVNIQLSVDIVRQRGDIGVALTQRELAPQQTAFFYVYQNNNNTLRG